MYDLRMYTYLPSPVKFKTQMSLDTPRKHDWITWHHNDFYLPAYFHSAKGLKYYCEWLTDDSPWLSTSNERHSRQELEVVVLSIGMVIRELLGMAQLEPEEPLPDHVPEYWATSAAEFSMLETIVEPAAQRMVSGLAQESFNTPMNERMNTRTKAAREKATELATR